MIERSVLRIGNCSGFYGDRLGAAKEMVEGGPIDILTGDYLAELTMLILWKNRQRDPESGYATSFVAQMEQVLGTCLDRGIKIVANAGGLNPSGLARRLADLAERLGLHPSIAYIKGDDVLGSLNDLGKAGVAMTHLDTGQALGDASVTPVTANAYLGAWGIVEALDTGADIVICPRVTDASVVVGPAAWAFSWARSDWDRLAGAVVAGHILECGAQTTGGNFSFFTEIDKPVHPGLPIAEMSPDGSCIITKHPNTGGAVTTETVTAQLLYEIDRPQYFNPDVIAHFETIKLRQAGMDRVEVSGTKGSPAPTSAKVALNYTGGYRNTVTFMLTGLNIDAKAKFAEEGLFYEAGGKDQFADVDVRLVRSDHEDARTNAEAVARLIVTVRDPDPAKVGRSFFDAATSIGLSNYPGTFSERADRRPAEYGVYWPALMPANLLDYQVVLADGTTHSVTYPPPGAVDPSTQEIPDYTEDTHLGSSVSGGVKKVPLGSIVGARSGDKGGNANVGLWVRDLKAYAWLVEHLTVDRFRELLPEANGMIIKRYELPNIGALNFVVYGLLQEGVAASTRSDPQAKGLGEYIRSRYLDIPEELLGGVS